MKKYDIIVGIDPDVEKSGVATLRLPSKYANFNAFTFAQTMKYFDLLKEVQQEDKKTIAIVVEASWMIKANWHLMRSDNARIAASKGYKVGANHEIGKLIAEMARDKGLHVVEHAPLRKCWRGKDGKITAEELASFTGVKKRSNQEMRDALLLAWCFADLPIRLRCG